MSSWRGSERRCAATGGGPRSWPGRPRWTCPAGTWSRGACTRRCGTWPAASRRRRASETTTSPTSTPPTCPGPPRTRSSRPGTGCSHVCPPRCRSATRPASTCGTRRSSALRARPTSPPRRPSIPTMTRPPASASVPTPAAGGASTPRTACPTCSTWWCVPTRCSPRPGSTGPRPNAGAATGPPSPSCPCPRRREPQPLVALPGSLLAHLGVVLGQVALDPVAVLPRQVGAAARALHDVPGGHHAARHGLDLPVDDVGDEQLVCGEVVLVGTVVPDVGVAVLLVRLVLGLAPPPYPLLSGGAIPF